MDTALVESLGLTLQTLFASQGKIAHDKFPQIMEIIGKQTPVSIQTLVGVVEGFKLWCIACQLPTKLDLLQQHAVSLFRGLTILAAAQDGAVLADDGELYKGEVYVAHVLAEALDTVAKMDTSETLLSYFAPMAFVTIQAILSIPTLHFAEKLAGQKDTIDTYRTSVVCSLLSIYPCQKDTKIPAAIGVIHRVLHGSFYSEDMKQRARTALVALGTIDRDSIINASSSLIEMFKVDTTGEVLQVYITVPEVYFKNPNEVHNNITYFFEREYGMSGLLFKFIADRYPEILAPYLSFFVEKISQTSYGALSLHVIAAIASITPNDVYAKKSDILTRAMTVPSHETLVAEILVQMTSSSSVVAIADEVFLDLLHMMEACDDTSVHGNLLRYIASLVPRVSSAVVMKNWPRVAAFRSAAEDVYVALESFLGHQPLAAASGSIKAPSEPAMDVASAPAASTA